MKPTTSPEASGSNDRIGQLYMLVAMTIAGTIGYFVLLSEQNSFSVVFFRCAIGAVFLSLYCWVMKLNPPNKINLASLARLIFGSLTLIFNWYFLFSAYRMTSVGITTIVYNVQPFLLLIAGCIVQKYRPTLLSVFWLIGAFSGLIILAQPNAENLSIDYILGIGCALIAASLYAATTLLTKTLTATVRPEIIATCHMSIGALIFLPLVDFDHLPSSLAQQSAIATLGIFHTAVMYIFLYGAFKKATTTSIAVLSFIYPLVAVLVDFFAYGKIMSAQQILGGALILFSAIAYAAKLRLNWVFGRSSTEKRDSEFKR